MLMVSSKLGRSPSDSCKAIEKQWQHIFAQTPLPRCQYHCGCAVVDIMGILTWFHPLFVLSWWFI